MPADHELEEPPEHFVCPTCDDQDPALLAWECSGAVSDLCPEGEDEAFARDVFGFTEL